MSEEERYTLEEAHREFGKRTNGRVWNLLAKPDRTAADDEEMVLNAYASHYHWLQIGTEVNQQRGEWLIAHVYTLQGKADLALGHAERCLQITEAHRDQMADFDIAYGYEGIARAKALAGKQEEAAKYREMARSAGEAIDDSEDKEIFMGDWNSGPWFDLS
jgi:hypothetical protein